MYIYSLQNKNNLKEIYIGKTNNVTNRLYSHKHCALHKIDRPIYNWINKVGFDNLQVNIELECSNTDADMFEKQTIEKYEQLGYQIFNEQLKQGYNPTNNVYKKFNQREEVWHLYSTTNISRYDIMQVFNISSSLLSKIIAEHGGSNRKGKLYGHYEEIQNAIMAGVSIHSLAMKYGVHKNAIKNINDGKTAFNPNLNYPLNQFVREEVMKRSQFKPKV